MKILKTIYDFLLKKHGCAFMRICYLALIPCAIWKQFCCVWMWAMDFVLILIIHAKSKGWDNETQL